MINSWSGGFLGRVTITAGSQAIKGWSISWAFPDGQRIRALWGGSYTQRGANVRSSNTVHNGALAPGAAVSISFVATCGTANKPPAHISVTTT